MGKPPRLLRLPAFGRNGLAMTVGSLPLRKEEETRGAPFLSSQGNRGSQSRILNVFTIWLKTASSASAPPSSDLMDISQIKLSF